MSWTDLPNLELDLSEALASFDWPRTDDLCQTLITRLRTEADIVPADRAKSILQKLRRRRRFQAMASLAEALLEFGLQAPQIELQYAQALIELGYLGPAELVLQGIGKGAQPSAFEQAEALGLKGRVNKQRYVMAAPTRAQSRSYLETAVADYLAGYRADPVKNSWHGINAVALIYRAHRDGMPLEHVPDADDIARAILGVLTNQREMANPTPFWELATIMEAQIALGDFQAAEATAFDYAGAQGADAFEFASTHRQLSEVWGLTDQMPPGSNVLPILRAALLRRQGGGIQIAPEQAGADLEKVFGPDRFKNYTWYTLGLERCEGIARIETHAGTGKGTGWLINAGDFFGDRQDGEVLLLTNAHVISRSRPPSALLPAQARVNFSRSQTICEIEEIVWSSPDLDATIVSLKSSPPGAEGLPIAKEPAAMGEPAPRLYIIGHPGGGDLAFSLQDNVMLDCTSRLLHYRTPTEGGSSGSPVFEEDAWQVVALHHGGKASMPRLGEQPGTYEANEGISIHAIKSATQAFKQGIPLGT